MIEGQDRARTILQEDVEALLDEQVGIEDDQAEGEGQHIIAGPFLEEVADGSLQWEDARQPRDVGEVGKPSTATSPLAGDDEWRRTGKGMDSASTYQTLLLVAIDLGQRRLRHCWSLASR